MPRIKTTNGPTTITNAQGTITRAPRSFADYLMGRSTATYSRPAKQPTQQRVNKTFKSSGPTSNGIGVGM